MDEKYFGMVNDEMTLGKVDPIFKDVTNFLRQNPDATVKELLSHLIKDENFEESDKKIRRNIENIINDIEVKQGARLALKAVDLSKYDLADGPANGLYEYKNINQGSDAEMSKFITDYDAKSVIDLFQDSQYSDPGSGKKISYKGLYIVLLKTPLGGR